MIVYCNAEDCKHNKDGKCFCKWHIGMEAICLLESAFGIMCEDYEEEAEVDRDERDFVPW